MTLAGSVTDSDGMLMFTSDELIQVYIFAQILYLFRLFGQEKEQTSRRLLTTHDDTPN